MHNTKSTFQSERCQEKYVLLKVAVRAEIWPGYLFLAIYIYRSPKSPHESCVEFRRKRLKSKMAAGGHFEK